MSINTNVIVISVKNALIDPVTLTFDISTQNHTKIIPCTKFEHFEIFRFWILLQTNKQINKQTNRRTRTSYPRRPTVRVTTFN